MAIEYRGAVLKFRIAPSAISLMEMAATGQGCGKIVVVLTKLQFHEVSQVRQR